MLRLSSSFSLSWQLSDLCLQGPTDLQHLMNIHFSSATLARAIENNPAMLYFVYNKVGRHSRGQEGPGLRSPPTGRVESRGCPSAPLLLRLELARCGVPRDRSCHAAAVTRVTVWPSRRLWLPCKIRATAGGAQDVVCVLVAHHFESGEFVCQLPFFPPIQEPAVRQHMTTIMGPP